MFIQPDCDISSYTFERTILMEERNKILTNLRMNNSKRHHYHDNNSYHSNLQPQLHQIIPIQSDSEDDEKSSHDPLLEPIAATPNLFTATSSVNDVVQLPSSPTSQLSM